MQRADGSLWIHSFAHGRTIYELKIDAPTIEQKLANVADADAVSVFARMVVDGDIDQSQREKIRDALSERCKVTKRSIDKTVTDAISEHARKRRQEERARKLAMRTDPRPQLVAPLPDAPWLPCMEGLNDVLGASKAAEPPARDVDGVVTQVRIRRVPNMHALTADGANQGKATD